MYFYHTVQTLYLEENFCYIDQTNDNYRSALFVSLVLP